MNEFVLQAQDLCYTYEDGTQALQGVDLAIRRGKRVAVMGPNGSGKSTLFLTFNGVLKPSSGRILLDGSPVDYSRQGLLELRRRVGIVFQDPDNQLFCADVTGEISFGPLNLGLSQEETKKRVDSVIREMGIEAFREKPTHFLSGGQKKRVSIADILVMEPDVLILDEPASALDPRHARLIDQVIESLSEKGITVLLSTHDVDRALIWADEIILMKEGVVLASGTPETIFYREELLAQTDLERPAVLRVFDALCSSGVLNRGLPIPRTVAELEQYITGRRKIQ